MGLLGKHQMRRMLDSLDKALVDICKADDDGALIVSTVRIQSVRDQLLMAAITDVAVEQTATALELAQ